ncbi:MAG: N-acetylmuramoyl-L-alanine amidase CwlD [Lachnospiraceae bacterium]
MAAGKQGKSLVMLITVCVLFIVGIVTYITAKDVFEEVSVKGNKKYKVVIDSGHGGIDPGKVGVNGAYEKDINLAIATCLKKELEDRDCEVVMTRETDTGLYNENDSNKKAADLKRRVELMNSEKPDVIVSIHQNSFTQESSKGAQVFYQASSEEGKKFAEIMQKQLSESLDKSNSRVAKPNADYYILKNSESVAIIVECGFLSNPQEAQMLVNKDYQKKVAEAVADGTLCYLEAAGAQKEA